MAQVHDTSRPDHYQVLGLSRQRDSAATATTAGLTAEDIKAAYKRALLRHHPDKATSATSDSRPSVDSITAAYRVLSDPGLRASYDRALLIHPAASADAAAVDVFHTGLDTVDLDDLKFDEPTATWTRACRCGHPEGFVVVEGDLLRNADHGEVITGCRGCSLWLKVLFSAAD